MKKYEQVKKFYNAQKAAEFLGVHKPELYAKWLRTGKLKPVFTDGRIKFYSETDLKKIKREIEK